MPITSVDTRLIDRGDRRACFSYKRACNGLRHESACTILTIRILVLVASRVSQPATAATVRVFTLQVMPTGTVCSKAGPMQLYPSRAAACTRHLR